MTVTRRCDRDGPSRLRVEVQGSEVVSAVDSFGQRFDPAETWFSIEGLFSTLEQGILSGGKVTYTYNGQYSFPEKIIIRDPTESRDSGVVYSVQDFSAQDMEGVKAKEPPRRAWHSCVTLNCHGDKAGPREFLHWPAAGDADCLGCHAGEREEHPERTGNEFMLVKDVTSELCANCHKSFASKMKAVRYTHQPAGEGKCSVCHDAHGNRSPAFLRSYRHPFTDQAPFGGPSSGLSGTCWECHDIEMIGAERTDSLTEFRNGDRNLHSVHAGQKKGPACRACHEIHGSEQPALMRTSLPTGIEGWTRPLTFTKTKTGAANKAQAIGRWAMIAGGRCKTRKAD